MPKSAPPTHSGGTTQEIKDIGFYDIRDCTIENLCPFRLPGIPGSPSRICDKYIQFILVTPGSDSEGDNIPGKTKPNENAEKMKGPLIAFADRATGET